MPQEAELSVLFADVSGSTQLYETLGDVRARAAVAGCIAVMTEVVRRHGGTLVKTIGDEVMTTFPSANAAAEAACDMQDGITGQMVVEGRPLTIRVGFHFGSLLIEEADVFGDAVNLASRMVNQAKSGQILTTGATADRLTGPMRETARQIDLAEVKGKREPIPIYELVWRREDATVMRGLAPWATQQRAGGRLVLTAGGTRLELGERHPTLTIGRAEQNDIVVRQPIVSRLHARIECRNGRFVLSDQSANGTYVAGDNGQSTLVHRDNLELTGAGTLGLGEAVTPGSAAMVRYEPG